MKSGLFVLTSLLPSIALATTLHSSDWESPASYTYTHNFGSTDVVAISGSGDHKLLFNTTGNSPSFYYDQIDYHIGGSAGAAYRVSFDVRTESLIDSNNHFVVLFDTPAVRNLYFNSDHSITLSGIGSNSPVGFFQNNQTVHIDMLFDTGLDQWDVMLDGVSIYSGAMADATALGSVRFSLGVKSAGMAADNSTNVLLDNVVISQVPVPAAAWLFGSALCGLVGCSRGRKRSNA